MKLVLIQDDLMLEIYDEIEHFDFDDYDNEVIQSAIELSEMIQAAVSLMRKEGE